MTRRQPRSRWLRTTSAVAAVMFATAVAACGGDDDAADSTPVESATVTSDATTSPDSTAESTVPAGDIDETAVLRYGTNFETGVPPVLDPARYQSNPGAAVADLIYGSMIRRTPNGLEPNLATAWELPDDSTIVLHLRDDVTFHDGTPFNAEAVKYAWDRVIATPTGPEPGQMTKVSAIAAMQSVEVVDDYTVKVTLSTPDASTFRDRLLVYGYAGLGVPSPTALQAATSDEDYAAHPVGAGPFEFVSYRSGQKLSLRKYDGYFDKDHYRLGGIDVIQLSAGAPTITALASDQIDVALLSASEIGAAKAQDLNVESVNYSNLTPRLLQFCTSKPPFDNPQARLAVAEAIDVEDLVDTVYPDGGATPNRLFAPEGSPFYFADLADKISYDPDAAQELFEQAGIDTSAEIVLMTNARSPDKEIAETIQSMLNDIGLNVTIKQSPNAVAEANETQPNIVLGVTAADYTQSALLLKDGSINFCGFDSPTVADAYIATRSATATDDELVAANRALTEGLLNEVPVAMLFDEAKNVAFRDGIVGARPGLSSDLDVSNIVVEK